MKPQALLKSTAYSIVVAALLVATIITVGNGLVAAELKMKASKIQVGPLDQRAKNFIGQGMLVELPEHMRWNDGRLKMFGVVVSEIKTPTQIGPGQRVKMLTNGSVVPIPYPVLSDEIAGYGTWQGNNSATIEAFVPADLGPGTKVEMYSVPGDVKIIWAR